MFAQLWKEDRLSKEKREEMEAALQLERNREMLKVRTSHSLCVYTVHVFATVPYE